jgi:hypothetical protein
MYKFLKKPYNLAVFEPVISFSLGGRDDHYTMPPGLPFLLITYDKDTWRFHRVQFHQLLNKSNPVFGLTFWVKYGPLCIVLPT